MRLDSAEFPNATTENVTVTSPSDIGYNCVAWALEETDTWWEPSRGGYWPRRLQRGSGVEVYAGLFQSRGFVIGADESLVAGTRKIALFAAGGAFRHVARQLVSGLWTSKMGQRIDIEHELRALEGPEYGTVVEIMSRLEA